MLKLNLNQKIEYKEASLRYFKPNEHHVARVSPFNVLLLVFSGVLRFSEDGVEKEVYAGEYYVQQIGKVQKGLIASSSPKYLYVHFYCEWTDNDGGLPIYGKFDYQTLRPLMEKLHFSCHNNESYVLQCSLFYSILTQLNSKTQVTVAERISEYLISNYDKRITLEDVASKFNFSKNQIINLFKARFKITPLAYLAIVRVKQAKLLLKNSTHLLEEIAFDCGFNDYSHFYKTFKKVTGISPRVFKNSKNFE